jgi:hypothetical protein
LGRAYLRPKARRIAANIAKLPELTARLVLPLGPIQILGQSQKSEVTSREARGRRGLGPMTLGRYLLLLGFVCLVIVVLTHVAERLHVSPRMGWGLPDSPGHYLDFVSAMLGTMLLVAGMIRISFNGRRSR